MTIPTNRGVVGRFKSVIAIRNYETAVEESGMPCLLALLRERKGCSLEACGTKIRGHPRTTFLPDTLEEFRPQIHPRGNTEVRLTQGYEARNL